LWPRCGADFLDRMNRINKMDLSRLGSDPCYSVNSVHSV